MFWAKKKVWSHITMMMVPYFGGYVGGTGPLSIQSDTVSLSTAKL